MKTRTAMASVILSILCAACSRQVSTEATIQKPDDEFRKRLERLYPFAGVWLVQDESQETFINEWLDSLKKRNDPEIEVRMCEAAMAAWSRSACSRSLTDKQRQLVGGILIEGWSATRSAKFCSEWPPEEQECLKPAEIAELYRLASEEYDKRGLERKESGHVGWKEADGEFTSLDLTNNGVKSWKKDELPDADKR